MHHLHGIFLFKRRSVLSRTKFSCTFNTSSQIANCDRTVFNIYGTSFWRSSILYNSLRLHSKNRKIDFIKSLLCLTRKKKITLNNMSLFANGCFRLKRIFRSEKYSVILYLLNCLIEFFLNLS